MSHVILSNVFKKFGDASVIHNVDLQIEKGEFVVFLGPPIMENYNVLVTRALPAYLYFWTMTFSPHLPLLPKKEVKKRIEVVAKILQIKNLLDTRSVALTEGQRQRLVTVRTILRNPEYSFLASHY